MNLQEEWNKLSDTLHNGSNDFSADQQMIKMESKGAYEMLIKRLKYKLAYCVAFTIAVLILALLGQGSVQHLLFAFALCFLLGSFMMINQLKSLPSTIDYTLISKLIVHQQLLRVKKVLRMERYWGYLFIPLSPLGGYLIGQLLKGKELSTVFLQTNWWHTAPLLLLVGIAGIYLAGKMNEVGFKSYLRKLELHQQELEG